ncbi:MAG TPA: hypothetical protein VHN16_06885 [Streptosporangiaceae bacterium]|nr:hypothetical protein [Streptosporangiaceae bacterium]
MVIAAAPLILDATTADSVLFAIAAHADEREAHIREVQRYGETLPEGSYGRRNRQAIAAREIRVAARLRAVERAYRIANERDAMLKPPQDLLDPVTSKVTTAPGNGRRSTTHPDTAIPPTCGNRTQLDGMGRNWHAW